MTPEQLAEKIDNLIELQAETNRLLQKMLDQYEYPIRVRVEQGNKGY